MAQQDATLLLDEDHNEVIRMFEQYKAAKDASKQKVLARQICQELLVHMQIEEEIFYPAYVKATGDQENLKDGLEEHKESRELIGKHTLRYTADFKLAPDGPSVPVGRQGP